MTNEIRPAVTLLLLFTLLLGLAYPLGMTGAANLLFPHQSAGSLIEKDGKVIGSELIGQYFTDAKYFHGRPSATTGTDASGASVPQPYNAANSMGSNFGPTSKALIERMKADTATLRAENPETSVPVDLVTTSASGFDPDITPAGALFQVTRVAKARNLDQKTIENLVAQFTQPRVLGIIGEPVVNVLQLNLALDELTINGTGTNADGQQQRSTD
ncbi:MAG: potassium-transporting ATPase subunit KdpC [Parvibaculaceae bacterium]